MIRSRLGLKALGTCALVLGLMAVWAGAAQAENPGGIWTYINSSGQLKTFEGTLHEPTIGGEIDSEHLLLLSKALGNPFEYLCKSFTVAEGKLQLEGKVIGKLVFHGCETYLSKVLSKACNPNAGGIHPELIETQQIKGQMLLHKLGDGTIHKVLVAEPVAGVNFAFVESSEACSVGKKVPVGGKFAIIDSEATTHLVKHLIKEFLALTALWVLSNNLEHKAEIDGSAWVFLSGEHTGLKWAGLWN